MGSEMCIRDRLIPVKELVLALNLKIESLNISVKRYSPTKSKKLKWPIFHHFRRNFLLVRRGLQKGVLLTKLADSVLLSQSIELVAFLTLQLQY